MCVGVALEAVVSTTEVDAKLHQIWLTHSKSISVSGNAGGS